MVAELPLCIRPTPYARFMWCILHIYCTYINNIYMHAYAWESQPENNEHKVAEMADPKWVRSMTQYRHRTYCAMTLHMHMHTFLTYWWRCHACKCTACVCVCARFWHFVWFLLSGLCVDFAATKRKCDEFEQFPTNFGCTDIWKRRENELSGTSE